MIAAVDETSPEGPSGLYYVVAAAVVIPQATLTTTIQNVLPPGRPNPFHWRLEGPAARNAMLSCIHELGVVSHVCVHYPTGRRRQEQARAACLDRLINKLLTEGVDHLMIESRTPRDDSRDQATILDTLNRLGRSGDMTYDWYPKKEPLIWIADGICGAVKEHLLGEDDTPFERLQRGGNIDQLIYLATPQTPKLRKSRLPS